MCRDAIDTSNEYADRNTLMQDEAEVDFDEEPSTGFEAAAWSGARTVEEDIQRIQAHVFRRRIRVKPFFARFDPLHTGRCSRNEFIRGVSCIIEPDNLSTEEPIDSEALAEKFLDPMAHYCEPQVVNYKKFCEVVDTVFVIPYLEKKPRLDVDKTISKVLDAGGFVPRYVGTDAAVLELLKKVAYLVEQRGINIQTCFSTVPRRLVDTRVGRIEPRDFIVHFPLAQSTPTRVAVLSRDDMQLLVERYSDDNGYVRLTPFEKDILALLDQHRLGIPLMEWEPPPSYTCTSNSKWFPLKPPLEKQRPQSARSPVQTLQDSVSGRRPQSARSSQHSQGSSRRSSWDKITPQRPHSARITTTAKENDDQELHPLILDDPSNAYSSLPGVGIVADMDEFGQKASEQEESSQRVPQRPQSARVARQNLPSTAALKQRPQTAKASRNLGCEHTPSKPPASMQRRRPQSARQSQPPMSVMAKITKVCFERRLRLLDIFKDADYLRKGEINRTQMCTALAVLGISLNPTELDFLYDSFSTMGSGFCYADCAAVVEDTIAAANDPTDKNAAALTKKLIRFGGNVPLNDHSDEEKQRMLEAVEELIATRLVGRRSDMLSIFEEMHRTAMPGYVSEGQFMRIMKNLNFELADKDLEVLLDRYCDSDKANEFNYVKFCRSLDTCLDNKNSRLQGRFGISSRPDTPKSGSRPQSAQQFKNPYYDKAGNVRPFGSRPPFTSIPMNGTGVLAAGWRPGAFIGRAATNCSI